MKRINAQKGFTLIELVVVIVILGILAATAAPKFIDLQDDAQTATLNAIAASMKSASTLVYSKSLIKGNQETDPKDTPKVNVNGTDIDIAFGYPRSNTGAAAVWTGELLDIDAAEFITIDTVDDSIIVYPADKTKPTSLTGSDKNKCFAFFTEAEDKDKPPVVDVVDC